MSESRSSARSADDEAALNEIAAELYALRPDAFADARDEHVRKARADGQQVLARELGRLRRPTQSAWLVNLLWQDQRDVMEQLFQLADELSRAQAEASGPDLHRLTAQRRELEAALIRRAGTLAENAGVSISASMEREAQETLAAALARPEVAAEVRSGRLVKPATYAGFGTGFGALVAAPAADAQPREAEQAEKVEIKRPAALRPAKSDELEVRRAARRDEAHRGQEAQRGEEAQRRKEAERRKAAERREAAERRVAEARAAVAEAADALAERSRAALAAHQHQQSAQTQQDDMRRQLEQLQHALRELEAEVASAEQAALAATRLRDQTANAHEAALRALAQAEQYLKESPRVD